jgi:hypothetical protein
MPSGLIEKDCNSFIWLAEALQVFQCKKVPILCAQVERLALKSVRKFTLPDILEPWS